MTHMHTRMHTHMTRCLENYLKDAISNSQCAILISCPTWNNPGDKYTIVSEHMLVATPSSNAESKPWRGTN